jgi:hypothetical protein
MVSNFIIPKFDFNKNGNGVFRFNRSKKSDGACKN